MVGIRDIMGFIQLDILPIQRLKRYDHISTRKIYTFEYDGELYYFKVCRGTEKIYNEMIAEELAKDFGIPCAHYDIAEYEGNIGILSKNIFAENDKYISIEELLMKYYDDFIQKYNDVLIFKNNNLEDIEYAFWKEFKEEQVVSNLMDQLILIFLFDILVGNRDRNIGNFGIVKNEQKISMAPLFDNEEMLSSNTIRFGGYCLAPSFEDYFFTFQDFDYEQNYIRKMIKRGNYNFTNLLLEKLDIISEDNIADVLSRVEKRINAEIPTALKIQLISKFEQNRNMIYNVLKELDVKVKVK